MTQITGIGFSNFRVFSKPTFFDLAPITIFTGTNSSGKSSVFKGLLLLNDNNASLNDLDFSGHLHKLGTYANALTFDSGRDVMEFAFKFEAKGAFFDNYQYVLQFGPSASNREGGKLVGYYIRDINSNTKLLSASKKSASLEIRFLFNKLENDIMPRFKLAYDEWQNNPLPSFKILGDIIKKSSIK
ncbi:ATP-binding protein [Pontibacter sp. BAB1700]|uniref:ATP-binding protein n=1 Tax=Pontibacter sp. BAB1700 TaxID=1144253 RepID=UPI00026BC986|nr:ATP-binding protein [Pontibacter sp. BAB1700]EJF10594.1 hypothetical protein O71_08143 [Pontibacter sp. BAB1700]